MNQTEVVVQGTLNADGTVQLDQKPGLLPGRVTVVLRPESAVELPEGDLFWQRMQVIWDAQQAAGHVPRTAETIEAERRQERGEWADRQQEIEWLQEESRRSRQAQEPKA